MKNKYFKLKKIETKQRFQTEKIFETKTFEREIKN